MSKKEITLNKRQLRKLFRDVFKSAEKMSYYVYNDKIERRMRIFVEDVALESIMRQRTNKLFK